MASTLVVTLRCSFRINRTIIYGGNNYRLNSFNPIEIVRYEDACHLFLPSLRIVSLGKKILRDFQIRRNDSKRLEKHI